MIAKIVSRIFDPFVVLGVTFVVLLSNTPVFVPAFLTMVILPLILFAVAWKIRFVSDWDVSDRRQRPKILWTLVAVEAIGTAVFQLAAIVPILVALAGFSVITHFWKISGHMLSVGLATGVIIERFGWQFWPVLLVVPLVAWARVVTHNHTTGQVIAGTIYAWALLLFFYEIR